MITVSQTGNVYDLRGLSTDEKPVQTETNKNLGNGSTFLEMDTGEVYIYDKENNIWRLL